MRASWQQAEYDAKSAILIDRDYKVPNPYGYCIRSLARQGAGKVDAAIRDLKHAASLSPNDTRIQTTVSAVEAARPPCPPPPVVTIDYSAFPHLIDMVISFANAATRVSLGSTCRALREKIIKIGELVHITTTEDGCWLLATFAQQSPMGLTFRDPTQVQGPKIHLCLVPDDHRERWADVWGIGLAKVVTLSGPMPASFVHSFTASLLAQRCCAFEPTRKDALSKTCRWTTLRRPRLSCFLSTSSTTPKLCAPYHCPTPSSASYGYFVPTAILLYSISPIHSFGRPSGSRVQMSQGISSWK